MMTNKYASRTILLSCLIFIVFGLPFVIEAADEPLPKVSEQWKKELKRLVVLSRLIADKPSWLHGKPSTQQLPDLSAEPFGCKSSDLSECLLSQIAVVLMQQATDPVSIFDATRGAAVQIDFMRATDVWSDKEIENNWDVFKQWTDAVGPAVLVLGAFMLSQDSNSNAAAALIGSGAGLLLVGNLGTLGQLFGGVNDTQRAQGARRTINTLQNIERSRQAYENSQIVYGFLDSYSNKAKNLLSTLVTLSNDAKDLVRAAPSPARSRKIVELCDKTKEVVSSLKETAGLADEYANQLSILYKKSHDAVLLPEDRKKLEDARQGVKKFSDAYNEEIVPFAQGVPEEIEAMQNIKAAVIANSIARKEYF